MDSEEIMFPSFSEPNKTFDNVKFDKFIIFRLLFFTLLIKYLKYLNVQAISPYQNH